MELWRVAVLEQWEAKLFQHEESPSATVAHNAAALAELDLLKRIRELDYEQFCSMIGAGDEQELS